jgi:hypothetical protein
MSTAFRESLSIPGLLKTVRHSFDSISDTLVNRGYSLTDCLLSGLAVFGLKYPSLLQFDQDQKDHVRHQNLTALYGIEQVPSDTQLRKRLDEVDPDQLRRAFKQVFATLQRGKGLEGFDYLDGHYLLSVDGTGYFSSAQVHCDQCCTKHHRDGRVTYYHQMLGAALVHPEQKEVFPLAPEAIIQQDGKTKNDCERNAAKRLLNHVRREHPHLKLIVLEDGLASNGPHIRTLKSLDMRFILGAKPSDHEFLFDWVATSEHTQEIAWEDEQHIKRRFRFLNGVPLNDANFDLEVNFLEYWETQPSGKALHFSWVTDWPITEANLMCLMPAGRARWRIENETFNTLKNQGYHFEHNFGHGYKHLSTVFAYLMMLAFLLDQIQRHCCPVFQKALKKAQRPLYFWQEMRALFLNFIVLDWETLYGGIIHGIKKPILTPAICDTS